MNPKYFKFFFTKNLYLGFYPRNEIEDRRLSFYYPIDHLNVRKHINFICFIKDINLLFHVNPLKGRSIVPEVGPIGLVCEVPFCQLF